MVKTSRHGKSWVTRVTRFLTNVLKKKRFPCRLCPGTYQSYPRVGCGSTEVRRPLPKGQEPEEEDEEEAEEDDGLEDFPMNIDETVHAPVTAPVPAPVSAPVAPPRPLYKMFTRHQSSMVPAPAAAQQEDRPFDSFATAPPSKKTLKHFFFSNIEVSSINLIA